jgi:hypothetical protein
MNTFYCIHTTLSRSRFQSELSRVQSTVFSLNFQYNLLSLRSSSSYVRLHHRSPVPSVFPPSTCFSRQFLRNLWLIQSAFFRFIVLRCSLPPRLLEILFHTIGPAHLVIICTTDYSSKIKTEPLTFEQHNFQK